MTANEYGTFSIGDTVYPLSASTSNSTLQDIDTPLFYLLDFCSSVLNIHMGARWQAVCTDIGRTDLIASNPITSSGVVQQCVPYDPTVYNLGTEFQYPLLAIYRKGSKMRELSRAWDRIEQEIGFLWILPQLTAAQAEQITPFLKSARDIIFNRNENGFDPNYMDGYSVGELAGFDAFGFLEATIDNIPVQNGSNQTIYMPTLIMGAMMRERNNPVNGEFEPFTGVDIETDLVNNPNDSPATNLPNFVDEQVTYP